MNDEKLLHAATAALERGNAARALEHLNAVDQVSEGAWTLRALALAQTGDEAGSFDAVHRGLSMGPDNPALLALRAELTERRDGPQAAETAYLALLRAHPNHTSGLLGYGWLLGSNGDTEGAKAVLARISGHIRNEVPDALALEGMIACSEGNLRESRAYLERGLQADPNSVRLHTLRALLASAGGEGAKRTSNHLQTAAEIDPRRAAQLGYEARFLSHWALAPMRLIDRVGTAQLWIAWIATFLTLRTLWPNGPIGWIVLVYVSFAIYTWVAPPLLRRWLRRKGEL